MTQMGIRISRQMSRTAEKPRKLRQPKVAAARFSWRLALAGGAVPLQGTAETVFERDRRFVSKQPFGLADIRLRITHIAISRGREDRLDVGANQPLKRRQQLAER